MLPVPQQAVDQQMLAPLFTCGECGEPVICFGQRFFRTCEHHAGVIVATPEAAKVVNANP
jgi:hypothetical protein